MSLGQMMATQMSRAREKAIQEAAKVDIETEIALPSADDIRRWIGWIASARTDGVALRRWQAVQDHLKPLAAVRSQAWAARWAYTRPRPRQAVAS